jgi:predicted O-methyltransferase YrrM
MTSTFSLVQEALELAKLVEFENSCIPEVGQLLCLLVAQAKAGVIAEIGTGCGVSSAWILSNLQPHQQFVSVEDNTALHQAVLELFGNEPRASFLSGNWRNILEHQPFQFAFVDVGDAKDKGVNEIVEATAIGGLIVLDDFTPLPLRENKADARRKSWLEHPKLIATEILTTPTTSALLAVKIN